jgi:hypothetical protein
LIKQKQTAAEQVEDETARKALNPLASRQAISDRQAEPAFQENHKRLKADRLAREVAADGEEMIDALSLSIFTIESDRKPVLAFAAKKHEEANTFFRDEAVRNKLRWASSGGAPLCDDLSILRIRLANAGERALYRGKLGEVIAEDRAIVFLVEIDDGVG